MMLVRGVIWLEKVGIKKPDFGGIIQWELNSKIQRDNGSETGAAVAE